MFANVPGYGAGPSLTDPVRQPAVEERLVGWAALGQTEVALALECLQRAQKHPLAARPPAQLKEPVERGEGLRPDAAIRHQVGIIASVAVERGQRPLEESD